MSKLRCIITDCRNDGCYIFRGYSLCHIHFDKEVTLETKLEEQTNV